MEAGRTTRKPSTRRMPRRDGPSANNKKHTKTSSIRTSGATTGSHHDLTRLLLMLARVCVAVLDDLRTGEVIDGESCCGLSLYRSTHRYATKGRSIKREAKDFETFKTRTSVTVQQTNGVSQCLQERTRRFTRAGPLSLRARAQHSRASARCARSRSLPIFYSTVHCKLGRCTKLSSLLAASHRFTNDPAPSVSPSSTL